MKIKFAERCAWRAVYVYSGDGSFNSPLRFTLGIDPQCGRAELFGAIGWRKDCTGSRNATWNWRVRLWRSRHWWRLDGRNRKAA